MGLLQRRELQSQTNYIIADRSIIIVGLGNPGREYDHTRHNIGFAIMDAIVKHFGAEMSSQKRLEAHTSTIQTATTMAILSKPQTFMNLSGESVQKMLNFYKLTTPQVLVIHDELDLPLGTIRLSQGGSAAGNNGIKSIIQHCGPDFWRLRIGVGPKLHPEQDSADFVLGKFAKSDQAHVENIIQDALDWTAELIAQRLKSTPDTRTVINLSKD
jgi:peptidyl-tRNA hydrolase, PTH1 family